MEKIKKTLLLGSSGQIGSNLKKKLKSISKQVKCLSKKDSTALKLSQHKNLPKWKKTSKFFHWKGRNYS